MVFVMADDLVATELESSGDYIVSHLEWFDHEPWKSLIQGAVTIQATPYTTAAAMSAGVNMGQARVAQTLYDTSSTNELICLLFTASEYFAPSSIYCTKADASVTNDIKLNTTNLGGATAATD